VVVLGAMVVVAAGAWLGPRGEPARAAVLAFQKAKDDAPAVKGKAKGKARERRGGQRVPGGAPPADARPAPDPLARGVAAAGGGGAAAPAPAGPPVWPFHYTLRMAAVDGVVLQASYFPARSAFRAPVVMLIHEMGAGHSGKDFEEPLDELKGQSFARHLQDQGYAVLALDLRGGGGGARREGPQAADWRAMVADLQAAYRFLVDRHNRGELNLARLAVVGLGDGANLALAWAAAPGGAVSSEGRLSDIAALVLISPVAEVPGQALARVVPELAARIPMLVVCGDQDEASVAAVRATQALFERHRQSRVVYHDTTLHAARLLGFYPKVAGGVVDFLDDLVGSRAVEWEPRYLLEPVEYGEVTLVADSGFEAPPAAPAAAPRNR
jgi:alpha-beta hydrolase superfamily lysophospholipase